MPVISDYGTRVKESAINITVHQAGQLLEFPTEKWSVIPGSISLKCVGICNQLRKNMKVRSNLGDLGVNGRITSK
jgi:hypothetical protein